MAVHGYNTIICSECGKPKSVYIYCNSRQHICYECENKEETTKKKKALNKLKKLTIKKRLEILEEWMYDSTHSNSDNFSTDLRDIKF